MLKYYEAYYWGQLKNEQRSLECIREAEKRDPTYTFPNKPEDIIVLKYAIKKNPAGGDEFACALVYEKDDDGEELLQNIYHQFYLHNQHSEKPYNVTVSAGACRVDEENGLTLQHALTQADERLYQVKMRRSKDVAKE